MERQVLVFRDGGPRSISVYDLLVGDLYKIN